ncbi:MAG: hypothetical protein R3335_02150 [Anaerolineales bacterium]|nr:hypothetical protein [Anaerolineales bacterium]
MDKILRDDLDNLLQAPGGWCISIYMPAHRTGREAQQDRIRLKNLIAEVRKDLESLGVRTPDADDLLDPAQGLLTDADFWQHQSDGLALFRSSGSFFTYRLPVKFIAQSVVSQRFIIKPLIPMLAGDGRFYVLALSQKQVKLYLGSRFDIQEVDIEEVPESLAAALRFDDPERQLQFQTGTDSPRVRGERPAIFHGHGVGSDDAKTDLLRFFHKIDGALGEYLNTNQAPLVLAGVAYLLPIYREANSYPGLIEAGIEGNPDEVRPEELQKQAWQIVSPQFEQKEKSALARYGQLEGGGGELVSSDLTSALAAAQQGRVETLFVALDGQTWGSYDSGDGEPEIYESYRPGAVDLLDLAAAHTMINSGQVYALPSRNIPEEGQLAAIFRYPLN